ncbi:type IV secretory system conjugative DNA transfer family protein [Skermania piniformis]|uniref:TraM recognition domain-containing protein n=1 Tax=Skermania pinensis TaxID=39122 RepID=A0ABX8SCC1_9ACTN|nr:TraM recognition domain-containing protein [Skermania piniformis]QXQ15427.1 TraM recognition domain-containing protein [Skermania piniformis]
MAKLESEDRAVLIGTAAVALGFAILFVAMHVGTALSGVTQDVPGNPIAILIELVKGDLTWPFGATVVGLVLLLLVAAVVWLFRRRRGGRTKTEHPVDKKAQHMAAGSALAPLTEQGARAKAKDLGMKLRPIDPPGVVIGRSVAGNERLYGSYEDLQLDIWGPRQGKSTSRVIPAIVEAIGPVIVTSNKRDVVDATRDVRADKGHPVWVFDPQEITRDAATPEDAEPTWYWDPLAWVGGKALRAEQLAGHFADADDLTEGSKDTFFESEAEDLLAALFLAGSLAKKPITDVWRWITDDASPTREAVKILRDNGRASVADGLNMQYAAHPQQRGGVFGTAKKMARSLKMDVIQPWVTPGDGRTPLDIEQFLAGAGGTLYCLSLEGRGSAAPLVSALSWAVVEVAMRESTKQPGGRLTRPLLAVLDEAANVVRWRDLPKQYSHFGSRGIVVMTILQSWAQGENCWGRGGMAALWSAATIKVLGGGVDDVAFLRDRSEAIGSHEVVSESVTTSRGGRSRSTSAGASVTMSVSDLQSLPRGRAILFASGISPTLIRTESWWNGPEKKTIQASIDRHNPVHPRKPTLDDMSTSDATKSNTPENVVDLRKPKVAQEVRGL